MATVDIVFRTTTWEGYDSHVSSYETEAAALQAVSRSMEKGSGNSRSHVQKIIINRPAEDEFTLDEVKELITQLSQDSLPSTLFRSGKETLGSHVFTTVDRSREAVQANEVPVWFVFEYRGKTYKWTGIQYRTYKWSGPQYNTFIKWDDVNEIVETRQELKVLTTTSWV